MQPLTCPIPSNINPLASNGFMFSINKLPDLSYFCQEVNLPDLSLPIAEGYTPLSNTPMPGDKINFGDLQVTFLIDEEMNNYMGIHNWMVGLGFPQSHEQYRNFVNEQAAPSPLVAGYSDGTLAILGASNRAVRVIRFVDLVPTSLQSLLLQSTVNETVYLAGVASFQYTYYMFE